MGNLKVSVSATVSKDFSNGKMTFIIRDLDADKMCNAIKITDVSFAEFKKAAEHVTKEDIRKWFDRNCCELRQFLSANNISHKVLGKWGDKYIPYSRLLLCRRMNREVENWGDKEFCKKEKERLFGDDADAGRKYLRYLSAELKSIVEKQSLSVSQDDTQHAEICSVEKENSGCSR